MLKRHVSRIAVVGLALLSLVGQAGLAAGLPPVRFAAKPTQIVLFVIDGLSYKVWDKMDLPVLER